MRRGTLLAIFGSTLMLGAMGCGRPSPAGAPTSNPAAPPTPYNVQAGGMMPAAPTARSAPVARSAPAPRQRVGTPLRLGPGSTLYAGGGIGIPYSALRPTTPRVLIPAPSISDWQQASAKVNIERATDYARNQAAETMATAAQLARLRPELSYADSQVQLLESILRSSRLSPTERRELEKKLAEAHQRVSDLEDIVLPRIGQRGGSPGSQ